MLVPMLMLNMQSDINAITSGRPGSVMTHFRPASHGTTLFPKPVAVVVQACYVQRYQSTSLSGKEKTHKHKQICGIVPGLGGCQNFVHVLFFSGHSLWGRKTHTVVAEMITELICFEAEVCICDGN